MTLPAGMSAIRSILRRLLNAFRAFCGGFVVYMVLGNLLGFVLAGKWTDQPSCMPFHGMFMLVDIRCPDPLINAFWKITLGVPRFLILYALTHLFLDISIVKYSIGFFLLIWAGAAFWWKRHRGVALVLLALVVGQILYVVWLSEIRAILTPPH